MYTLYIDSNNGHWASKLNIWSTKKTSPCKFRFNFQFQRIGNASFVPLYSVPKKLPRAEYGLYCNVDGPAFCYRVYSTTTYCIGSCCTTETENECSSYVNICLFFVYIFILNTSLPCPCILQGRASLQQGTPKSPPPPW